MKITIVEPNVYWSDLSLDIMDRIPRHLEWCGRNCYKSEDKIKAGSDEKFVKRICDREHESVLEHATLTAKFVISRAASHQLVRHRIGSYSQESMRYCNYGKKGLQVICPPSIGIPPGTYNPEYTWMNGNQSRWLERVGACYQEYLNELDEGVKPEDARFILPHSTKTEVVTTYNISMWRHVIRERALNKRAQWEIKNVMMQAYIDLVGFIPCAFGDLE